MLEQHSGQVDGQILASGRFDKGWENRTETGLFTNTKWITRRRYGCRTAVWKPGRFYSPMRHKAHIRKNRLTFFQDSREL